MDESCSNCRFMKKSECHKNPPLGVQKPGSSVANDLDADWPTIRNPEQSWCGAFEPRNAG